MVNEVLLKENHQAAEKEDAAVAFDLAQDHEPFLRRVLEG
jgi:hypothetical protein